MNFREFIKYLRFNVLDEGYNDLEVSFEDKEISFRLYDMAEVAIIYNGDVNNIRVYGYNQDSDCSGMDFSEIKDIYGVMKAIKDNSEMLDGFINMKD